MSLENHVRRPCVPASCVPSPCGQSPGCRRGFTRQKRVETARCVRRRRGVGDNLAGPYISGKQAPSTGVNCALSEWRFHVETNDGMGEALIMTE
ncbi:uncharacterized protein LOC135100814 isoform X2 [Scylla paramamosain]|uniref:uncharacterized protein LOC135100814 isoform X2 n=1 Tax=Scylla paramamosain TaxID=85552 RepID=UPI003082DDE7